MVVNADFAREIRDKSIENRKKYEELKRQVDNLIIYAAYVEASWCDFEILHKSTYASYIDKLVGDLIKDKFVVQVVSGSSKTILKIMWR